MDGDAISLQANCSAPTLRKTATYACDASKYVVPSMRKRKRMCCDEKRLCCWLRSGTLLRGEARGWERCCMPQVDKRHQQCWSRHTKGPCCRGEARQDTAANPAADERLARSRGPAGLPAHLSSWPPTDKTCRAAALQRGRAGCISKPMSAEKSILPHPSRCGRIALETGKNRMAVRSGGKAFAGRV